EAGWRRLWQAYSDSIPADVTDLLWQRIMDSTYQIDALVAEGTAGKGPESLIGIANYILHPCTWVNEPVCYLEDLFVSENAQGKGVGRALVDALIDIAKKQGWARVYWHTHKRNKKAKALYKQIAPRDPFIRYVVYVA